MEHHTLEEKTQPKISTRIINSIIFGGAMIGTIALAEENITKQETNWEGKKIRVHELLGGNNLAIDIGDNTRVLTCYRTKQGTDDQAFYAISEQTPYGQSTFRAPSEKFAKYLPVCSAAYESIRIK